MKKIFIFFMLFVVWEQTQAQYVGVTTTSQTTTTAGGNKKLRFVWGSNVFNISDSLIKNSAAIATTNGKIDSLNSVTEKVANKNQPNGYAGLSSGLINPAQVPDFYLKYSGGTLTGDVQQTADPVNGNSLVRKSYIDNALTGITWKNAVRLKTTGNITLSGLQTIDAVAAVAGNRVLVNNQTDPTQNGIYLVSAGAWTRVTDADSGDELETATVAVTLGTVGKNTQWTSTTQAPIVVGTTPISFGQISGAGTYTNGTGINLSSNVFSLDLNYNATGSHSGLMSSSDYTRLLNTSGTNTGDQTNITGNAGTVTNGVYTTGSYANPSWITSLANTKITYTGSASNFLKGDGTIVPLASNDVNTALGYTPYNPANYPVTLNGETLQSVTTRGAVTNRPLTLSAYTNTAIPYFGTGGLLSQDVNFNYTNGNLGLGTTAPTAKLNFGGTTLPTSGVGRGIYWNGILKATADNDALYKIDLMGGAYDNTATQLNTFNNLVGGSGYTNGTYTNVPLTGGTTPATANITVSGGAVTAVTIVTKGAGYTTGNVISASSANLGGTGSGFSITVLTTFFSNITARDLRANNIASTGLGVGNIGDQIVGTPTNYYQSMTALTMWTTAIRGIDNGGLDMMQQSGLRYGHWYGTGNLVLNAAGSTFTDNGYKLDVFNGSSRVSGLIPTANFTATQRGLYLNNSFIPQDDGDVLSQLDISPTFPTANRVETFTFTGGSGYTNGTYSILPLVGGSGSNAVISVTVSGGVVTSATIVRRGSNYTVGNVLTASGLTGGTGFTVTVTAVGNYTTNKYAIRSLSTEQSLFSGNLITGAKDSYSSTAAYGTLGALDKVPLEYLQTATTTNQVRSYRAITSATTISASDYTVTATSGTFTQPLPATPTTGQIFNVKNTGTGTITVTSTSIDGQTSIPLQQYDNLTVQYTGTSGVYIIL